MVSATARYLFPIILVFCVIDVFSVNNSTFDVHLMAILGVAGYVLRMLDAEPTPMLLAFILGPMMEEFLCRALLLSRGDPLVLMTRPISGVLLAVAAVLLTMVLLPALKKPRAAAFQDG